MDEDTSQEETCTLKYKEDFHQNSSLENILLDKDREDKTPGINQEQETPTYDTSFEDHLPEEEDFQEEEDHCMEENLPDCENCGNMAYAYCADCANNYCQACSTLRHRMSQRRNHQITRLSLLITAKTRSCPSEEEPTPINDQLEAQVTGMLVKYFGIRQLKQWQMNVIQATIEGRNTVIIHPTGSGKSICFQLPHLITGKGTIVITPTISLMHDQTSKLQQSGIRASFLGSTQKDPSVLKQFVDGSVDVLFVTVERLFAGGEVNADFVTMATEGKIGLIAVDEAHLFTVWKSFRPDYSRLTRLSSTFPRVPLMALTATAPPSVFNEILTITPRAFLSKSSVNQENITYRVLKLNRGAKVSSGKEQTLKETVKQLLPLIEDKKAIIYLDFAKDIDSLAIALRQAGVESCTYKGQNMSGHDKTKVMENWCGGEIKVMVCTSAFGMGVNQPDVDVVIHIGVPPTIECMVQEFGRAGRDGRQAEGIVLYSESDLSHAEFWCKSNDPDDVLPNFQHTWRYVFCHVVGKCRRQTILQYFEEDNVSPSHVGVCCDVCEMSTTDDLQDFVQEITTILQVVQEIPGNGEKKLANWIRGSASKSLAELLEKTPTQDTFGNGAAFRYSMEMWRRLIRQAWLLGLINRNMKRGVGARMVNGVIYNVYEITSEGATFLSDPRETLLLSIDHDSQEKTEEEEDDSSVKRVTRKGKGSQAIAIIRDLMKSSETWFPITSSKDYHFPGVFEHPPPKRMGYCPDITKLPNYEKTDPDFLYADIQLGKGKARNQRQASMVVDGTDEDVTYRVVPCGGVKQCSEESCKYVVSTRETKPCPDHPSKKLKRTEYCPVEFVYIKPQSLNDNRRWLTGLVRGPSRDAQNLHNHPIHGDMKIPGKIDADIRRAIISNPQLKTKDIVIGTGMEYMPGAASLAATHRGKIKNIRLSTLRDASQNVDPRACILDFEKEAVAYDKKQKLTTKSEGGHMEEYASIGHPYVMDYSVSSSFTWILSMSPLMAEVLSKADFMEVDITYKASVEMEYLFNAVTFNYTTMKWMAVARVHLNSINTSAYAQCFRAIFDGVSKYFPAFSVGKSLVGILMDWSDQQYNGLEEIVGESTAKSIVKGCQVHFMRSVKRVAHTVSKGDQLAYEAFKAIGYHVLKANSKEAILTLFEVLGGQLPLDDAIAILPTSKTLQTYLPHHSPNKWKPCQHWQEWWTRPRHLRMLSSATSSMDPASFTSLPSSTNAVESLHRATKQKYPDVLRVALMTVYKVDMAQTLEHIAAKKQIPTTYERLTPDVCTARLRTTKKANMKRMRDKANDDDEGPPDKRSNFKPNKRKDEEQTGKTSSSSLESEIQWWVKELDLSETEREQLLKKQKLTDKHIYAATKLLKMEFPEVPGNQSSLLSQTGGFKRQGEGSVQIHHDLQRGHWATSTMRGGKVVLYDSKRTSGLSRDMKEQLMTVYGGSQDVTVPHITQQRGSKDCGLFAIAYAWHLALGDNMEEINFQQKAMRNHLESCFTSIKLQPFPHTHRRTTRLDCDCHNL